MKKLSFIALMLLATSFVATTEAQDKQIDVSKIPSSADRPEQFAPSGWKVEKTANGDLNGDGKIDHAISLIEDKKFDPDDLPGPDRDRVLVVVFTDGDKLKRAAVAEKLLQCTSCGGAFYGVVDAPVNVSISKGIIVIQQDHGSRDVSSSTLRFRYNIESDRFVLIGYDYSDEDRLTGKSWKESTNYVTGLRLTTTGNGKRTTTKRTTIKPTPIYLDTIDSDEFEYAAVQRLGLG